MDNKTVKIMSIFGTRPEGIKFAPIIHRFMLTKWIDQITVNTGQHLEMLDQVLKKFNIVPHYNLKVMKPNQKLEEVTADMIVKISIILEKEKPELVLVLGDTATTFAGAYAAFLKGIPVGHIEAGLRTFDIYSPFPEEMYRQLVTRISNYHFAPTTKNKENLLSENIKPDKIVVTGNPVIDALFEIGNRPHTYSKEFAQIIDQRKRIILITTHRRENFSQLKNVYLAINQLVQSFPDIEVIFPVHLNPTVRKQVADYLLDNERIHVTEPLDYETFVHIMKRTYMVITDSGGIQEEAPAFDIPVLVARESTERPEGVAAGTLKVVGTSADSIIKEATRLLTDQKEYIRMAQSINPYGDGTAALRIVDFLNLELN